MSDIVNRIQQMLLRRPDDPDSPTPDVRQLLDDAALRIQELQSEEFMARWKLARAEARIDTLVRAMNKLLEVT